MFLLRFYISMKVYTMNFQVKVFSLLAGAIALSVPLVSTLPAFAQSTNPPAPTQQEHMRRHNFLNLTSEQQSQIEQIRQDTRSQIDAILTEEQRAQLQSERDSRGPRPGGDQGMPHPGGDQGMPRPDAGQRPGSGGDQGMRHSPFASLNLTAEQQSQIEAVMRSSRERMDAVLTSEQRQQLQQHLQQRQQNRPTNPPAAQPR
jgi:periplasmic protein CpxP/Spy